jgi:hypothetical protein
MWSYASSTDETRVSKDNVDEDEVKKVVRRLANLATTDEVSIACQDERFARTIPCLRYVMSTCILSFLLLLVGLLFICFLYPSGPSLLFLSRLFLRVEMCLRLPLPLRVRQPTPAPPQRRVPSGRLTRHFLPLGPRHSLPATIKV